MSLKIWIKNWLSLSPVKEYLSPINGPMQVTMVLNKPRLIVGGMLQSGGLVRQIWNKAINQIFREKVKVEKALVLGLGCGDCAFAIHQRYPQAQMTGIEIDAQVVDAAQCYFDLAVLKNLKITIGDGLTYVKKRASAKGRSSSGRKFDLIIIDVYLGKDAPQSFRSKSFFNQLKQLLNPNGVVIYNHLFFDEHRSKAQGLIKVIETVLPKISLQRTASNLLIFARRN